MDARRVLCHGLPIKTRATLIPKRGLKRSDPSAPPLISPIGKATSYLEITRQKRAPGLPDHRFQ